MKNYEEMAQSVLKRRDIGIKRRRRAFLIGAPCAAAVLVGVAGIGTVVAAHSRGKQPVDLINYHPGDAGSSSAEIAEAVSSADIAAVEPEQIDYTNHNVGQTNINWIYLEDIHMDNGADVDGCDFNEYTLDGLDRFYGLRFSRFSELYPDWVLSYDKLGTYTRDYTENTAGLDVCVHELVSNRNTLNYTTEYGGKVTVTAQKSKFEPLSPDYADHEENTSVPEPEIHTEYDENGNVIGQTAAGYDPAASRPADYSATEDDQSKYRSVINGYPAVVCAQIPKNGTSRDNFFAADIAMSSNVRIIAEGVTFRKFEEILDNFTNNIEGPFKITDNITNPDVGKNDIKVQYLDEFNIPDDSLYKNDGTFKEYSFEGLDSIYHLRFNILQELHPDWELSHDKLGAYRRTVKDGEVTMLAWARNTLNYTTDSGAKITVFANYNSYAPDFTYVKPEHPSKHILEYILDEAGNPIGKVIDPNDYDPEPDEGVSTVNGCEALICRNADGNFLAYIDMEWTVVRITAEGLSEEEFLAVLDEYTKYKL